MSNEKEVFENDLQEEDKEKNESECQAIINRENFENDLDNMWGYSKAGIQAKKAAMTMLSTKTGMYARIPLVCKSDNCPYASTCKLLNYDLAPYGEPCPIETAGIEYRYAEYAKQFNLDEGNFTDRTLVSDLINLDIMLERCKALLSEGSLIEEEFAGVSEQGDVDTKPEVTKKLDAYERIKNRRDKTYNLMLATRNDNKDKKEQDTSVATMINDILSKDSFVVEETPEEFIDAKIRY